MAAIPLLVRIVTDHAGRVYWPVLVFEKSFSGSL
jgi:hypothetical protein